MTLPIHDTIKKLTPTLVAREMGLPISTVFRWMNEDRIPGRGPAHQWRVERFEEAVNKIKASLKDAPRRQPRKKAA